MPTYKITATVTDGTEKQISGILTAENRVKAWDNFHDIMGMGYVVNTVEEVV